MRALKARVVWPGDAGYDRARRTSQPGDGYPAVILRAFDAGEVAVGVAFAEAAGLPLAVRTGRGGSATLGSIDGALLIDVSHHRGRVAAGHDDIEALLREDHDRNPR
jgi:hypothetical protein